MEALLDGVYVNETGAKQALLDAGLYLNETATVIVTFSIAPTSDTDIGDWTDSEGGTTALYSKVNEETPDDRNGNYVQSGTNPSGDVLKLGFPAVLDPAIHTDHTLKYRFYASGDAVTVRLMEGATEIASWTHNAGDVVQFTTFEQTLSTVEAAAITDYGDLHFEIEAG